MLVLLAASTCRNRRRRLPRRCAYMRGFGETDVPDDVHAYTIAHNVGDMVGLVGALGDRSAVIVGHDWGAPVGWTAAQLRPDIFRAVAAMSRTL
jgi:pimeloyl-ACP methyl ester carboxylesterase